MVNELTEHEIKNSKKQQVFYYYDKPVLYTCICKNNRYLVLLVDENNNSQTWFYTLIDDIQYKQLLKNKIDLYSVFKFAELRYIYEVIIDKKNYHYKISKLPVHKIPDSYLPEKNIS